MIRSLFRRPGWVPSGLLGWIPAPRPEPEPEHAVAARRRSPKLKFAQALKNADLPDNSTKDHPWRHPTGCPYEIHGGPLGGDEMPRSRNKPYERWLTKWTNARRLPGYRLVEDEYSDRLYHVHERPRIVYADGVWTATRSHLRYNHNPSAVFGPDLAGVVDQVYALGTVQT